MKTPYILLLSTLLLFSSCWQEEVEEVKQEPVSTKVEVLEIGSEANWKNFTVIWEVFSEKESVFSSKVTWDIVKINVKIWDKVNSWDVLMEIYSDSLHTALNNSKKNYQNSLNTLNRTIASTNKAIESSKISVSNAQKVYDMTLEQIDLQKNKHKRVYQAQRFQPNYK